MKDYIRGAIPLLSLAIAWFLITTTLFQVYAWAITPISVFLLLIIWRNRWTPRIQQQYANLSIVGILLQHRQNASLLAMGFLMLTYAALTLYTTLTNTLIEQWVFALFPTLVLLIALRTVLFSYRVCKGLYGRNEYEAREIIQFILDNADRIDFTDGGKPKRVLTAEDLEEITARVRGLVSSQPTMA